MVGAEKRPKCAWRRFCRTHMQHFTETQISNIYWVCMCYHRLGPPDSYRPFFVDSVSIHTQHAREVENENELQHSHDTAYTRWYSLHVVSIYNRYRQALRVCGNISPERVTIWFVPCQMAACIASKRHRRTADFAGECCAFIQSTPHHDAVPLPFSPFR